MLFMMLRFLYKGRGSLAVMYKHERPGTSNPKKGNTVLITTCTALGNDENSNCDKKGLRSD